MGTEILLGCLGIIFHGYGNFFVGIIFHGYMLESLLNDFMEMKEFFFFFFFLVDWGIVRVLQNLNWWNGIWARLILWGASLFVYWDFEVVFLEQGIFVNIMMIG